MNIIWLNMTILKFWFLQMFMPSSIAWLPCTFAEQSNGIYQWMCISRKDREKMYLCRNKIKLQIEIFFQLLKYDVEIACMHDFICMNSCITSTSLRKLLNNTTYRPYLCFKFPFSLIEWYVFTNCMKCMFLGKAQTWQGILLVWHLWQG